MRKITVLITGAGAPGIQGTIYSLKNNYDKREIKVVGTDINAFAVGKYLCDDFFVIPPARDSHRYLTKMLDICVNKKVDVILPQNTSELAILSENIALFENKGIKVCISKKNAILNANNKYLIFETAKQLGIPVAESFLASTFNELKESAVKLGWPNKKVVVKPPVSNGSRGVRIISENLDRKKAFYEEKPSSLNTTLDELHSVLGEEFPELIVMEYLPGDEYTVDVFRDNDHLISIPRKRVMIRSGITFAAILERNESIIKYSNLLAEAINLQYCFGFQFKMSEMNEPLLLESNPRIQGTMIMSTLANANIIYSSVKSLLNEQIPEFKIDWETEFHRYWGGIGIKNESIERI